MLATDFAPRIPELHLNLDSPSLQVRERTHGSGEEFWFAEDAPLVPFSWSQMLLSSGSVAEIVGSGVTSIKVFFRADCYDHRRAAFYVKKKRAAAESALCMGFPGHSERWHGNAAASATAEERRYRFGAV